MRIFSYIVLALVLVVKLGCSGCEESEQAPSDIKVDASAQAKESDAGKVEAPPREAFGVPFPPEVEHVEMNEYQARVLTKLNQAEVKSFYELRLTDFEFVRETAQTSRFIGLHDHQPDIEIFQRRARYDTRVWIRPKPGQVEHYPKSTFGKLEGESPDAGHSGKPRKGQPVKTVTRSGEELAPGARWGEPYVPPKGSPLADPRYKSNWGRPFGEWIPQ